MSDQILKTLIGSTLLVMGTPLLVFSKLMYWYLDQTLKPVIDWQERVLPLWLGPTYRTQREMLRWLVPVFIVLMGVAFLVSAARTFL